MKSFNFSFTLIIFLFYISFLQAGARVSFSRPGQMMRIPSVDHSIAKKFITINIANEFFSSYQQNSSFSISTINKLGYYYGISFVKPENPTNSNEMGFHIQKNILVHEDINIDIGIHDIVFRHGDYESNGLNTNNLSLFAILSNNKTFKDYSISTHLGIGTGKLVQDPESYTSDPSQEIGAFLGFELKTPFFKNNTNISILTEFGNTGINIGVRIPFLRLYQINLGITHLENLGNFAAADKNGSDYSPQLRPNASAIILGFTMNIPRLSNIYKTISSASDYENGIYSKTDSSVLFYDPICTEIVEILRDSIRLTNSLIKNLDDHNIMLLHKEAVLTDSTQKYLARKKISQSEQNTAMRHLSRSLRLFYDERYQEALEKVNLAINANPNLAIAYGRKGSIYYKLGDMRRATLNWNAALQLDPEFTEIHDMLKASNDNRLESIEIGKISKKD